MSVVVVQRRIGARQFKLAHVVDKVREDDIQIGDFIPRRIPFD